MDKLLQPLTDGGYNNEIRDIKYLTYTAKDPYRSTFIKYADEMKIGTLEYDPSEPQNYSSATKKISFNISKWNGDYTVFFHECGHNIDDLLKTNPSHPTESNAKWATTTYHNADGKTLMDMAMNDVIRKNEKQEDIELRIIIKVTTIAKDLLMTAKKEITEAIMNCPKAAGYSPKFPSDNEEIIQCYKNVIHSIISMGTRTSIAASDIYGGFTGNLLKIKKYHDEADEKRVYWIKGTYDVVTKVLTPEYDANNNVIYTGNQAKELFAETYAAQMTKNNKEMNEIHSHFATAEKIIEEIISLQ